VNHRERGLTIRRGVIRSPPLADVKARAAFDPGPYGVGMKHVMYAEKSLLMGDEVADSLLEYARLLAEASHADTVTVRAIGVDGNTVDAAFLLNPTSVMMVESTNSTVEPPDNEEAVRYLQERIERLSRPPGVQAEEDGAIFYDDDIDLRGQ
jgi:hypothetical protein